MKISEKEKIFLGIYDSLGFEDTELLKYVLEGQKDENIDLLENEGL